MKDEEMVRMGQDIVRLAVESLSAPEVATWVRPPLFGAVRAGNERLALLLLEVASCDDILATTYGERQHTLLHAAALGGNPKIFKAVLAKKKESAAAAAAAVANSKSQVGARDVVGRTPLHLAAMRGNVAVARALLRAGGQAEVVDVLGRTPLHVACELGHDELATDLLLRGAKVETRDTDGLTPLHLAARGGHTAALGVLLRASADPEERTPPSLLFGGGLSALDLATKNGKIVTMARLLADGGCEVDGHDPVTNTTALHHAAGDHHHGEAAMRVLLQAGASVASVSKTHGTPLHRAVSAGFPGGVRALLAAGADENASHEQSGETPLSMLEARHPRGHVARVREWGRAAGSRISAASLEVKRLLLRAPADRAWRRRGWLVVLRARELAGAAGAAMGAAAEAPAVQVEIKKEEGRRRKIERLGRGGRGHTQAGDSGGDGPSEAAAGPEALWSGRGATASSEGWRYFPGAVHLLLDLPEPAAFEAVVAFL